MVVASRAHLSRQRFQREKYRLTCEVLHLGERHSGIVTDLSASGLFVRTSQLPPKGTTLRVRLQRDDGGQTIELDARVVRIHKRSRHHTTAVASGLGLQILSAPESYFHFLASLTSKRTTG